MSPSSPASSSSVSSLPEKRIVQVLHWLAWVAGVSTIIQLAAVLVADARQFTFGAALTALCFVVILAARLLAARGAAQASLIAMVGVFLASTLVIALTIPNSAAELLLLMMLIAIIAHGILIGRALQRALLACCITGILTTTINVLGTNQARALAEPLPSFANLLLLWILAALVLRILWLFHQRLLEVLTQQEQTTMALERQNERLLTDITAHQRTQQALLRSEERFSRVFQSNLLGMGILAIVDGDVRIVEANERFLRQIDSTRDEAIGRTLSELDIGIDENDRQLLQRLRTEHTLRFQELHYRTRNGISREVLTSLEFIGDVEEPYIISMTQDLSQSRLTEMALRESENQYRLIAENTQDLIALLDEQAQYVYISPSHQRVLGYHVAQLVGSCLFDLIHHDDIAAFQAYWRQLGSDGQQQISTRFHKSDDTWCWFEVQATAVNQADDLTIVLVARDITQRRNLETQFHQAQKMESVGRLAGGVAHDFNNLLSAITGYTELVLEDLPEDASVRPDLIEIQRAAGRAAMLSRQLLALARRQVIDVRVTNLNDLIYELDKLLRRLLGEDIELVTLLSLEPCMARVDLGQIEQVLINLAVNARDAMPGGGKLVIETHHVTLDESYVQSHVGTQAGEYVLITVTDNGIGMEAQVRQEAFEPFFTTKPAGKGTGLGLATCYGIVKQHDGNILCYSEVGKGTTFKVYLPRVREPATSSNISLPSEMPRGTETILLAEDETSVRELAARLLRSLGYTVLEGSNGDEALRLAQNYGEAPIHLLLSDLVMPQLGGVALAQSLLHQRPGVRVLFMSGYPGNAAVEHGHLATSSAFLQKPFSVTLLATKVRDVLDSKQ